MLVGVLRSRAGRGPPLRSSGRSLADPRRALGRIARGIVETADALDRTPRRNPRRGRGPGAEYAVAFRTRRSVDSLAASQPGNGQGFGHDIERSATAWPTYSCSALISDLETNLNEGNAERCGATVQVGLRIHLKPTSPATEERPSVLHAVRWAACRRSLLQ